MRLPVIVTLITIFGAVDASAACQRVPLTETPKALVSAFARRMAEVGANDWQLATQTSRGPMYISSASQVRLAVKDEGGLVGEATVLLSEPTTADSVRLEVAATFLAAHISGAPEAAFQSRIIRAIADIRKSREPLIIRDGETALVFSRPEPEAVAVVSGRLRCD